MSCDLFVFAGEKSGDLHGEKLLTALKTLHPHLKIAGVGGPRMRALGMHCILPMEKFQVMGFVDVFLALPQLFRHFYFLGRTLLKMRPKVVLFIDYPGFNLRMARYLRRKGFRGKVCHFICPSVWAWGKNRIPLMAKNLDLLLSILPFEKKYFRKTNLDVKFVGHPLVKRLQTHPYASIPLPQDKKIVALFSGSRKKEIERNLPRVLTTCNTLAKSHPDLHFALSLSDEKYRPLITQILAAYPHLSISLIPADKTYELMRAAHMAIAKSGTVTLELALHAVPTVVTYAISPLDLFIARDLLRIRLPYYCLVNIIASGEVFPELFGPHFTEEALTTHAEKLLTDTPTRDAQQRKCHALHSQLTDRDASLEAAKHLGKLFSK